MLQNEKDLVKQKLSSKPQSNPAKAAVPKSLTQNRQNIPRSSWQNVPRSSTQNDKSKTARVSSSIKTMFQKAPGKTKASHQPKAEMEANKEKKAKKDNIWTADANSDVSDSQLNNSNDSDETQIV